METRLKNTFSRKAKRGALAVAFAAAATLIGLNTHAAPQGPCTSGAALSSLMQAAPLPGETWTHNDYRQDFPLCGSLMQGISTVEADIWHVNGQLLVSHNYPFPGMAQTLEQLYLDPLAKLVREQGGVYRDGGATPFTISVELKDRQRGVIDALAATLQRYQDENPGLFTVFNDKGVVQKGAIRIVIDTTGHAAPPRAFFDQHPERLFAPMTWPGDKTYQGIFSPIVNAYSLNDARKGGLEKFVTAAHAQDREVRIYGGAEIGKENSPAQRLVWQELRAAGVDYIVTDHPAALRAFLVP